MLLQVHSSTSSWFDKLTMTRTPVVTLPADRSEAEVGACRSIAEG